MHSGGGCKEEPYEKIYIEAPEEEAKIIFYNRFGHNPERVTCACCGDDYSIGEHDSLAIATGYDRNCESGYVNAQGEEDVLVIRASEIAPEQRVGKVPEQGYVWRD